MIDLDVRTLYVITMLLSCLVAGAMAVLWRTNPSDQGARGWAIGAGLIAIGALILALIGVVPSGVARIVGNPLVVGGYAFLLSGTGRFVGRSVPDWLPAASAVFMGLVVIFFMYVVPSFDARVVIISALCGTMGLWCAGILLFRPAPGMALVQGMVAFFFLFHAIPLMVRAILPLVGAAPFSTLFEPGLFQSMVSIGIIVSYVGFGFGAAAMTHRRLHLHLSHLATHDLLTGTLNRHAIEENAARERARARRQGYPLSLLMLDIDHFKHVNDAYGHEAGDAVLRAFAGVVRVSLRRDDILGRYGGEEFVALLPMADRAEALAVAERIRAAVAATPVAYANRTIGVTVSIGTALFADGEGAWEAAIRAADDALYRAKREGRNRVAV